jgi:2-C-methyl-D-erythritol 4-phosphate cytidylyltransferase/2-C-methyl-D-erythritol 2,4-cyclodiphosphate synthase
VSKEIRVGTGLDVHKFSNEKSLDGVLTMGGIQIAHPFKLIGHSDADVVLHSVTDAILGAIGGKDIGFLFPDTDVKWKGADSALFLKEAINLARKKSATINNIDLTIICEKPRISQYRDEMQKAIANIVGINETRVNIKGKTTEKLGFLGRGEGVAVQAVATVSITVTEE